MKRTARYYARNPEARRRKQLYDSQYQKKPSAVKKRVEANRANREAGTYGNGDNRDYDHSVRRMVPQSVNRGRRQKSRLKGSKRS